MPSNKSIMYFAVLAIFIMSTCTMILLKPAHDQWDSSALNNQKWDIQDPRNNSSAIAIVVNESHASNASNLNFDQIVNKDKFLAITYASYTNDKFCKTLYSSMANRVPLMVVGLGESSDKLNKIPAFSKIANQLLNSNPDITLVFLDGFDVLFQQGPKEILKKYKEINASLVYSAEKNCWPGNNKTYCEEYPRNLQVEEMYKQTQYEDESQEVNWPVRFLNSGLMIGSALESASFFKEALHYIEKGYTDDQEIASLIFTSGKLNMTIDYDSRLFQSMWSSFRDLEINLKDGLFQNIRTKTFPSLIHFNGDKSGFEPTEGKLWYKQEQFVDSRGKSLHGFFIPNGEIVSFKDKCH